MAAKVETIVVAAGILVEHSRVLITQRKRGAHLAGAWEFPGGKVEPGEDPRDALVRELAEELGLETLVSNVVEVTFHRYEDRAVLLLFFTASRVPSSADPRALDVADFRWASLEDLVDEQFPPADVAVLAKVRRLLAGGEVVSGA